MLEQVSMIEQLHREIERFHLHTKPVIAGGDWNTIMDPTNDQEKEIANSHNEKLTRAAIEAMLESFHWQDTYRYKYPNKKATTNYTRNNSRRLDKFYATTTFLQSHANDTKKEYKHKFIKTTHYRITLNITLQNLNHQGPSTIQSELIKRSSKIYLSQLLPT